MRKHPKKQRSAAVVEDRWPEPPARRELLLLAAILIAGIALRGLALSRSAVEHFDEGVYASNLFFGPPDYAYPDQRFYAPPLLGALIEAGMIAGLPPNVAALLPGFLAGCATIIAVWWFGRSWFGPEVGLAAAALAALSDFHIAFSTAALTDVLLGLWIVLAADSVARSLYRSDYRWAIAAGIYTGLAWWTKYNGWLPLAIEAAALPLLWLLLRPPRRQLLRWLGCFAVTSLVAVAIWSPYYYSLQPQGGYGPISANHAKYVVGFGGWLDSAARQIANQYVLESPLSALGVALAWALPGLLARHHVWQRIWRGGASVGIGTLVIFWSSFVVIGVGALIGLARIVVALRQARHQDAAWQRRAIGLAIVATWWVALLLATPSYTPYPRLALPWLLAAWLGMAMNCADFRCADDARPLLSTVPRLRYALIVTGIVSIFLVPWLFFPRGTPLEFPADRRGLVRLTREMRAEFTSQPRAVYVFGEPAIFFQLRAAGELIVEPLGDLPTQKASIRGNPIPTYLVVGPHATRDPRFQSHFAALQDRLELQQAYDYQPSAVVWLDLNDPRQVKSAERNSRVELYRMK